MKQLINYQDNIFFIQNVASCLEEAVHLELTQEFTGQLLESLIESLHAACLAMYKHIEASTLLKDQSELLRLCVLASNTFCNALQELGEDKHSEMLNGFSKLSVASIKALLSWHEEKTAALMSRLSDEEHEQSDKLSGLSSDELSGLLG